MSELSKRTLDWYGVKLLHKITISGMPDQDKMDEFFQNTNVFFEESVLLVKASSFDNAYQIAETTAKKDNDVYENKYGQTVNHEFYNLIDCFCLFNSPDSTVEIYSTFFQKEQDKGEKMQLDKRYNMCTAEELHLLRHK